MIQGDADTIVTPAAVEKLAAKLSTQRGIAIDYHVIPGADHFFTHQLDQLSALVGDYIDHHDSFYEEIPKKVAALCSR